MNKHTPPTIVRWDGKGWRRHTLLTNADFNPGDIVRCHDKEWRVQGINDNDPNFGLLLLGVAELEDSPDFYTSFPVTRGSNRRPRNGCGHRWGWARAKNVELVSRGKPE